MKCLYKDEKNKILIKQMTLELDSDLAPIQILNYSGSDIQTNPKNGMESSLYQSCLNLFLDKQFASKVTATIYSSLFIENFGDWLHMEYENPRLDTEGMPKLFFKNKKNNKIYTSIKDAVFDLIYSALSSKLSSELAFNLTSNFSNNLQKYNETKNSEDFAKLFTSILNLSLYNILNTLDNIECGFLSKTLSNLEYIENQMDFIKVVNNYSINFEKFLDIFTDQSFTKIQLNILQIIYDLEENNTINFHSNTADLYNTLTFDSLSNASDTNLRKLHDLIQSTDTEFSLELATNQELFLHFLQGIIASIWTNNTPLSENSLSETIKSAKNVSQKLSTVFGSYQFFLDSSKSLNLMAPEIGRYVPRTKNANTAIMQDLLSLCSSNPTIDELLIAISNSDSKLAGLAKSLIGKSSAIILLHEDSWLITDYENKNRLTAGLYESARNTLHLSKKPYVDPALLILHETLHSITVSTIRNPLYTQRALDIFNEAQLLILEKYKVKSVADLPQRLSYGFLNMDEFYSELWTNSTFIKELNSVGPKGKKSFISRIKQLILDALGIKIEDSSDIFLRASELLDEMIDKPFEETSLYQADYVSSLNELLPTDFYAFSPEEINAGEALPNIIQEGVNLAATIHYNEMQLKAIDEISALISPTLLNRNKPRVICRIIGKAGTGKTTIAPKIVEQLITSKNLHVCVSAVSNQAKTNLLYKFPTNINIDAKSIAALLGKKQITNENGELEWLDGEYFNLDNVIKYCQSLDLLIVDESSMLDDKTMNLIELYCNNASIIYIGDKRQLRPITKDYVPVSPFVTRDVDYSIELLERVRQGEGSPILDLADVFGDVSAEPTEDNYAAISRMSHMLNTLSTEHNNIIATNALLSVNDGSIEHTVDTLLPLIREAIATENINKIGIVPFHRAVRDEYNNQIRYKLLKERGISVSLNPKDINYVGNIPYLLGEIIILDGPFKSDTEILDNGLKLVIDEPGKLIDSPEYHIYWRGNDVILQVFSYKAHYIDLAGIKHTVSLPILAYNSERYYKDHLDELRLKYSYTHSKLDLKKLTNFREIIARVFPAWALNIHKAQGLTYELSYIPVNDYYNHTVEQRTKTSSLNICTSYASEIYTAMTRASNITILGSNSYTSLAPENLAEINENINQEKNKLRNLVEVQLEEKPLEEKKVIKSTRLKLILPKYQKLYDFLYFVTGSDDLFKSLKNKEAKEKAAYYNLLLFQRETELIKLGKTFGKVELKDGIYDYKSLLKDPTVLFYPITEERLKEYEEKYGMFTDIENTEVKSALAVIPKQYAETFFLGSHSLAEINPSFFRHVNNHYWSKVKDSDFLVRTHTTQFNIAFISDPEKAEKFGNRIKIEQDSQQYRLDADGYRMYKMPNNSAIYQTKEGNETIVIFNTKDDKKGMIKAIFSSLDDIVSIQPFLTNIEDLELAKSLIKVSLAFTKFSITEPKLVSKFDQIRSKPNITLQELKQELYDYYNNDNIAATYAKKLSNTLYLSFVKACSITSSRIPTQALASFMDMQVVAYNPEAANEVFVSRWQMWLQGSKHKISNQLLHKFIEKPYNYIKLEPLNIW